MRLTIVQRLIVVATIAMLFFILEITVGFLTHSLVLVADAFHILSDVIGYIVALLAILYGKKPEVGGSQFTYGYKRAEVLGAFFNGGESLVVMFRQGEHR